MTDVTHKYQAITVGGKLIVLSIILLIISSCIQWVIMLIAAAIYIYSAIGGA